jgi:lipopolysaccharide export system permease protein
MAVKRLHRFIFQSYIGPFILTFFISIFLLLMQFLWKYIDDLIGKGLDIDVIFELLLYASAGLVPLALPLAILLSSIMTFGNLAEHNELMAIKSAGISLFRIMNPLIVFIFFVGIGAFYFSNNVMPYTNLKMGALLYDVRHQKPEISIKEGVFSNALPGYTIRVSRKSKKTSMLYDIMIYNHIQGEGNRIVTVADSGTMVVTNDSKYLVFTMYNGKSYSEEIEKQRKRENKEYPNRIDRFEQQRILIDMSGLGFERTDEDLFKNHYQMLNLNQLKFTVDSLTLSHLKRENVFVDVLKRGNYFKRIDYEILDSVWYKKDSIAIVSLSVDSLFNTFTDAKKKQVFEDARNYARSTQSYITSSSTELTHKQQWIKRHEIEYHRKFTLSFACLLLFFIGAPLGAIIRKGGMGLPVVVSVLFFVIYYVITISGEKYAKIGEWPSWLGMWISAIILFPIGIFLTYKAAHDSVLLNTETYIEPLKRYFKRLFNRVKAPQDIASNDNNNADVSVNNPPKL